MLLHLLSPGVNWASELKIEVPTVACSCCDVMVEGLVAIGAGGEILYWNPLVDLEWVVWGCELLIVSRGVALDRGQLIVIEGVALGTSTAVPVGKGPDPS